MKSSLVSIIFTASFLFLQSCGAPSDQAGTGIHRMSGDCKAQDYPAPETSEYILPFPQGQQYKVTQGNCSTFTHHGDYRYAYDFNLPTGATVTAARGGVVVSIQEDHQDGTGKENEANYIAIRHFEDDTIAYYGHLTYQGVSRVSQLEIGAIVKQGDVLGAAGNSGKSTGAHLDFTVRAYAGSAETLPITFRNSYPLVSGPLIEGISYEAREL